MLRKPKELEWLCLSSVRQPLKISTKKNVFRSENNNEEKENLTVNYDCVAKKCAKKRKSSKSLLFYS